MELMRDGNAWMATEPGFIHLGCSEAGFGLTQEAAVADLNKRLGTSFALKDFTLVCQGLHRAMSLTI